MSKDPQMERNYFLALILSMAVLLGYPFLMKITSPPPPQEVQEEAPEAVSAEELPAVEERSVPDPLKEPEGPFLQPAAPAAVIPFENELFQIEFTTQGGTLSRLLYKGSGQAAGTAETLFYEGDPNRPGLFGTRFLHDAVDLTRTPFKLHKQAREEGLFEFVYEKPGEYRLLKRYHVRSQEPVIWLEVEIENKSGRRRHFPLEFSYALDYGQAKGYDLQMTQAVVSADKLYSEKEHKVVKKGFRVDENIQWAGLVKKYFALLVRPNWKSIAALSEGADQVLWSSLRMEPLTLSAGGQTSREFFIYAGPQHYETLKNFGGGFEALMSRGFFGIFKIWLLLALKFFYGFTHNFGWAIILLTLLIKAAFTPLTHMSFESMKKMQALQPKTKAIQERYKSDPAKMQKEMMGLYKRNRVNPMGGCLPMLFQIPIFIAFYHVLGEAIELNGAPFIWWIQDLAAPDALFSFPATLPLVGSSFNVLPILMLVSMVVQQKLTPSAGVSPEQAKMMTFLPLVFGFIFYSMPSGLVLYWFVNNVLSIAHQAFVKSKDFVLHHEDRD